MPSPGGLSPGWSAQRSACGTRWDVRCHPDDLPEGYQTAPRGQAWHDRCGYQRKLPPRCGPVGLRQVDGMAPRQTPVGTERIRSEPPSSPHHHPAPGDTNAQLRRHGTAPGDRTRAANSAFGTKRSQVQILSPRPGQVSRVTGSWGLTGKPARPLSAGITAWNTAAAMLSTGSLGGPEGERWVNISRSI